MSELYFLEQKLVMTPYVWYTISVVHINKKHRENITDFRHDFS